VRIEKLIAGVGIIMCSLFSLNGCIAALPVMVGVAAAGAAVGVVTVVNLARDQYPDIDFDKPAPVVTIYSDNYETVWNAIIDTLMQMKESTAMMDKSSGIIRTNKRNMNDVSWIGKGLGSASFQYEYNIIVRKKSDGVNVELMIPFWEEKMFVAAKEKNVPEGSNMMRHIFFKQLNERLHPVAVKLPDSPMQDIRHSPMTKETQPRSQGEGIGKGDIAKAQERLNQKGYNVGTPDGIAGKKTRQAISQFQKVNGLSVTGQLDQQTLDKLAE